MDTVLTPEIAAFCGDPVMMIFSPETRSGWPSIGRGLGARVTGPRTLDLFMAAGRYPDAVRLLAEGRRIAVTITRVGDYVSYQFKGAAVLRAADDADLAFVRRYRKTVTDVFGPAGVEAAAIEEWVGGEDLVRATIDVSEIYVQTPGPLAGTALGRPQ